MKNRISSLALPTACLLLGATSGCVNNPVCDSAACAKDVSINTEVRSLLDEHPGLSPEQIHVATRNQVVSLSGIVDNEMELEIAQQIVEQARGVAGVVNLLAVNNR